MAFALAPLDDADARALTAELRAQRLLGPLRGLPRVDMDQLRAILLAWRSSPPTTRRSQRST